MPRYDYHCSAGHVTETIKGFDVRTIDCPECGQLSTRSSVHLISQSNLAHIPADQRPLKIGAFEEASQELAYQHAEIAKHLPEDSYQMPDYIGVGIARGKQALAGKAAPPKGWTDPHG
jgi:hypothetical protein